MVHHHLFPKPPSTRPSRHPTQKTPISLSQSNPSKTNPIHPSLQKPQFPRPSLAPHGPLKLLEPQQPGTLPLLHLPLHRIQQPQPHQPQRTLARPRRRSPQLDMYGRRRRPLGRVPGLRGQVRDLRVEGQEVGGEGWRRRG